MNCSRFAHKDILKSLETGNFSRDSFQDYETTLKRGTKNWYNFITVYYRLNVLFTAFVQDPRYRLDVLKLLQGDVYDEAEPAVLTRMRNIVRQVEKDPNHASARFPGRSHGRRVCRSCCQPKIRQYAWPPHERAANTARYWEKHGI